jgi:acyl transferase domain-containing protein/thioesterase domain-containing protein/NADP-dependent 3-hydroxy acid dehydrogenase YdfG
VKSNIGHSQAAAGVAGVIKMVLALRHGLLPKTLHVERPTDQVDWSTGAVSLLTQQRPWTPNGQPRRAGISSFGISGTNAHVILEEGPAPTPEEPLAPTSEEPLAPTPEEPLAPTSEEPPAPTPEEPPAPTLEEEPQGGGEPQAEPDKLVLPSDTSVLPWVLSAREPEALYMQAQRLHEHLRADAELQPLDVGLSLAGRSLFAHRAVILGATREELLSGLTAAAGGEPAAGVVAGAAPESGRVGLAFLCSGQGAQRLGMGRELYASQRVFREAFDEICGELDTLLECTLREVVFAEERSPEAALLDDTTFAQAGLFALEVALARLLAHWEVRPDAVIGHSIGELTAAHLAGVFSLADACRLVAARGRLMGALPAGGAMASIEASEDEILPDLADREHELALAAVNGPSSVVISGDEDAVLELARAWRDRGRRTKRLRVSHAFHSPRMDAMLEEFAAVAVEIELREPRIPLVSNLTGGLVAAEEVCTADYWVRHVREPVRFLAGVRALVGEGLTCMLELGPDGVLSAMTMDCLAHESGLAREGALAHEGSLAHEGALAHEGGLAHEGALARARGARGQAPALAVPVLRGERPEHGTLMEALAAVFVRGAHVGWSSIFAGSGARRAKLPSYAFQRQRYWLPAARAAGDPAGAGQVATAHPLLGAAVALAGEDGYLFTGRISTESHPWLADHLLLGMILLPATAYLELALYAGRQLECGRLREMTLELPLVLNERGPVQIQVAVGARDEAGRRPVTIYSRPQAEEGLAVEETWTRHASGLLVGEDAEGELSAAPEDFDPDLVASAGGAWPPADAERVEIDDLYERMADRELNYGPAFKGLRAIWRRGEEVFAEVALEQAEAAQAGSFGVHPALLDAALQAFLISGLDEEGTADARLPFAWGEVRLHSTGPASLRVHLTKAGEDGASLSVADAHGTPVASVESLSVRAVPAEQLAAARAGRRDSLFALDWVVLPAPAGSAAREGWVTLGGADSRPARGLAAADIQADAHEDLASLGAALDAGARAPELILLDCSAEHSPQDAIAAMHAAAQRGLHTIRGLLADERLADCRLAVLTRGAVGPGPLRVQPSDPAGGADGPSPLRVQPSDPAGGADGPSPLHEEPGDPAGGADGPSSLHEEPSDPAGGAVWGLMRAAALEHPGRLVVLDIDDHEPSWRALPAALACDEPQLALRAGAICAPRLARTGVRSMPDEQAPPRALDPRGTVLVTGGSGSLGAMLARHLVSAHGARHLLLVSRRGPDAEGARELAGELGELGAEVTLAACDVSDRAQLTRLLDALPEAHPLDAVVHAAGVLDDGLVDTLTPARLDRVLAAKADSAWYLHELTEHLDLSAFVLYSSVTGVFGSPGQASYAAANAFLDTLALHRRRHGLRGVSIAWGQWAQDGGMTGHLDEADLRRAARLGMTPLDSAEGLELFDLALGIDSGLAIAARLDLPRLRAHARTGSVPPLLRGLIHATPARAAGAVANSFVRRLAAVPDEQRAAAALEMVCAHVALVLGHASAAAVQPRRPFLELGFDSLAAIELRNRLDVVTGLHLPATVVFDHPSPIELAEHLRAEVQASNPRLGLEREHDEQTSSLAREPAALTAGEPREMLCALFRNAHELGRMEEFLTVLDGAAKLRPSFAEPLEGEHSPRAVVLAPAGVAPRVICIPSLIATAGPHQYARFAKALRGAHGVSAIPVPGFLHGERVPADMPAVVKTLAGAIGAEAQGTPFVLLGHSTGGLLAYAIAEHLQRAGLPAAGVVLIDVFTGTSSYEVFPRVLGSILQPDKAHASASDVGLTAMCVYLQLLDAWTPAEIASPTLLVQASEPLPGLSGDSDWRSGWTLAHRVTEVPGNHFSMMEGHADAVAGAVAEWIAATVHEEARA